MGAADAGHRNSIVGRDKTEAFRGWGAGGCGGGWGVLERRGIAKTVIDEAGGRDLRRGKYRGAAA